MFPTSSIDSKIRTAVGNRRWLHQRAHLDLRQEQVFRDDSAIDYLELYKKFKDKKLERYSLDLLRPTKVLRERKLPWTLAETSDYHWDDYVVYNIIDNYKIVQLEDKLKYIKQAFDGQRQQVSTDRCLFAREDVGCHCLLRVVSQKHLSTAENFGVSTDPSRWVCVGKPVCSVHKYLSVFDIASSYPHQIMQFNISPERILIRNFRKNWWRFGNDSPRR